LIGLYADGVVILEPGSPVAQLRLNMTLFASATENTRVNPSETWAPGTLNFAKGEIRFKPYAV
jgi:hypothetical protein